MCNTSRMIKLDGQWNILHIPRKPNGFAMLIVGDRDQYVNEDGSFWSQNTGRKMLVDCFLDHGYVVVNSNLYGNHWGCPNAIQYLKDLYHLIMSQEILNQQIHILAEGMGSLAAIQFMKQNETFIRSSAFLNPCFDLKGFLDQEKRYKLFYKKIIKEINTAYDIDVNKAEYTISTFNLEELVTEVPAKIWQRTGETSYPLDQHGRKYEELLSRVENPMEISIFLKELGYEIGESICKFFKKHERSL